MISLARPGVATIDYLVQWRDWLRSEGKSLVLTNGVFDLLHIGHARYLASARALGDALVIAVDTDESVRRLAKGDDRPIVPEADRAELLASLHAVDAVVLFEGPGAMGIIETLRPEIYVKGADYADGAKPLPEAAAVMAYGGKVSFIEFVPGRSTTSLLDRIRSSG